jgi:hypothetical protein
VLLCGDTETGGSCSKCTSTYNVKCRTLAVHRRGSHSDIAEDSRLVVLCHWASSSQSLKDFSAFICEVKQYQKNSHAGKLCLI